jgi:hypothetical protein
MATTIITILLVFASWPAAGQTDETRKREFLKLLLTLPTKGEFYTNEAVKKAEPYLPALFALTESDLESYDIYPFLAISRGMWERQKSRKYAARHFETIMHPTLKLFWASLLFEGKQPPPKVVIYLKKALESEGPAHLLSEMLGPQFGTFKARVLAYPVHER